MNRVELHVVADPLDGHLGVGGANLDTRNGVLSTVNKHIRCVVVTPLHLCFGPAVEADPVSFFGFVHEHGVFFSTLL